MSERHTILGGKVHLYRRNGSPIWHCATYMTGKNRRKSTKEESLSRAKDVAEDWYFSLRDQKRQGTLTHEKTFAEAAKRFLQEYEAITMGERNPEYVKGFESRLRVHILPFMGKKPLSAVNGGLMQEYRMYRLTPSAAGRRPARSTLHHEEVTIRQVMKTALRHKWIDHLPDFSAPYKASAKVSHRGWFTLEEYKRLYTATRENAQRYAGTDKKIVSAQLHDKVLFMANTGLRPDEVNQLQFRDVEVVVDEATGETILEIEVRGKRGVGYCKSMPGAVVPFQRVVERLNPQAADPVFPHNHKKQFNRILEELNLKEDRLGNRRTFYSLRHSYICFRLLEGADAANR